MSSARLAPRISTPTRRRVGYQARKAEQWPIHRMCTRFSRTSRLKSVGLDPNTNTMQSGYFVAFRDVGLPIHKEDFDNPWSPLGANLDQNIPDTPPADPATAPKTGSTGLDPNVKFAANIAKSQQSYLNTFMLTDDKLRMNNQYSVMPSSSKISDSWWAIITGANGIPTDSQISDALKAAYEAAKAKLMDADGNPTPHYQKYMEYEDDYKSKVRAWHKAYAAAFTDPMKLQSWPIQGVDYADDANSAWDKWQSSGSRPRSRTQSRRWPPRGPTRPSR